MKTPSAILLSGLLILAVPSCRYGHKDPDMDPEGTTLTGQWEFTFTPDQIYQDTNLIQGFRASDFEVYSSIADEVFLYEDGTGNIAGYSGSFRLSGAIAADHITLHVYEPPEGRYLPERPVEEMIRISTMELDLDAFRMLSGPGTYLPSVIYPPIVNNTYTAQGRLTNDLDRWGIVPFTLKSGLAVSNWEDDVCKVLYSIGSWIFTFLTDGIITPMSSTCWLSKDGGGYWTFGHEGPGSLSPLFTQTIYYPMEWSACHTREYSFTINLGGESLGYLTLKNSLINNPPVKDLISKLGFTGIQVFEQALDDFYNQFGGFAFTIFFNTNTKNTSLYVNISQGDPQAAANSVLAGAMHDAFQRFSHDVYVCAGSQISDSQLLRRSMALVCNTPIIVCYLFGTNKAEYN